ncbi:hypothetical protein [Mucilaginibacter sp. OK268]|uniref:hypothetical protein n=1 Tax=Mucilaginibacter sp. OK268 TaxID=1881048 RepID=UPI00115F7A16|nr:hypothetical protein [Mucilaginibacter sp. OK268]
MRKLLKVLLPVLIDFGIFWAIMEYNMPTHPMKLIEIGDGNLYSLMAYFHLFWPLLLAVGILTQYLIVVPLWDNQAVKSFKARLIIGICIAVVCIAFAGSISYIIWDQAEGTAPFYSFWWYLSEIQLFYWVFTFVILFLIDRRKFVKTVTPAEVESPA